MMTTSVKMNTQNSSRLRIISLTVMTRTSLYVYHCICVSLYTRWCIKREGRMLGKATRGRKRLLSDITSKDYVTLKRDAEDRSSWQKSVINQPHGRRPERRCIKSRTCVIYVYWAIWHFLKLLDSIILVNSVAVEHYFQMFIVTAVHCIDWG